MSDRALTPLQLETVRQIALGKPHKAIGKLKAVEARLYNGNSIKERLGFTNRVLLTHWAIVNGLVRAGEPLTNSLAKHC